MRLALAARTALDRIGVGLWTAQSTALAPRHPVALYRELVRDAALADELGLHSIWTAHHRVWYDGWCPAPLHLLAAAAARTRRLRFGTSVAMLPQQDPAAFAAAAAGLAELTDGRVDLGVGLGHRDDEYRALGIPRRRRGRLMDAALDELAARWEREPSAPRPALWIGGMSEPALERARARGHGLVLPQTLGAEEVGALVAGHRAAGGGGAIAVMRDVWVTEDAAEAARFRALLDRHYREEIGAWWSLKGRVGFAAPEQLARQLERVQAGALVGGAAAVAEGLSALLAAGGDLLSVRVMFDFVEPEAARGQLRALAERVAPAMDAAA